MAVNSFNAQNPPVNTKGDLFTFSTIPTKLGVGTNGQVLTADSTAATGIKWATPSGGKIAQVVSAVVTTASSTTSTSYVDATNYTLSITPTSSTSKILVLIDGLFGGEYTGDNSNQYSIGLVRGSTTIYEHRKGSFYEEGGSLTRYDRHQVGMTYLDSPATTSATTYKIQIKSFTGTVTVNPSYPGTGDSSITLMEVLA